MYVTESGLKLRSGAIQGPFYKPLNSCWLWAFLGLTDRENLIDKKDVLVGKEIMV